MSVCPKRTLSLRTKRGGPATVEKYGEELLSMVNAYREDKGIKEVSLPEPKVIETPAKRPAGQAKKEKGPGTKEISLAFFAQGMSAEEIAEERGLAVSTIQSHLCHYIEIGEVDVDRMVDAEKQAAIEAVITEGQTLSQIKAELGDDVSYGEIRAVLAHRKFMAAKEE